MKALVLAAGKSTRIADHVGGIPKPMIEIDGDTILEISLRWLARNNITDIYINLHHRPELIQGVIGDGEKTGTNVTYVFESPILGTAGAVKNLELNWDSDFLVVYGDNLMGFDIADMLAVHKSSDAIVTLAVYDWEKDTHSGIAGGRVIMNNQDTVTGFEEQSPDSGLKSNWVNAGAYICRQEICDHIPAGEFSDFGKDIFPGLLAKNIPVRGYPINSFCLAADTPEALEKTIGFFRGQKSEVRDQE